MKGVLLLNASYEPLNIISIQRAFKLWALGKVEIIEEGNEVWASQYVDLHVPLVVKLVQFVMHRKYIKPRLARRNIYIRDNFTCQYCGDKKVAGDLTIDHVNPRALGGHTTWGNVVTSCRGCNQMKADLSYRDAQEVLGMKLINGKPKKPNNMLLTIRLKYGYNVPELWESYMYAH